MRWPIHHLALLSQVRHPGSRPRRARASAPINIPTRNPRLPPLLLLPPTLTTLNPDCTLETLPTRPTHQHRHRHIPPQAAFRLIALSTATIPIISTTATTTTTTTTTDPPVWLIRLNPAITGPTAQPRVMAIAMTARRAPSNTWRTVALSISQKTTGQSHRPMWPCR